MKKTSHNITEHPQKQHYKKSYLVRILEAREAAEEIELCFYHEEINDSYVTPLEHPHRPT